MDAKKRYVFIGRAHDNKGTEVLVWFCMNNYTWYALTPELFWRK